MRARVEPEHVGLPAAGRRRRTPGLRIEEVAAVAGVSLTWYSALESGKGARVSANLLERVGDALRLNRDERAFLAALVRPLPSGGSGRDADPVLQAVVDGFRTGPAFVSDRFWNVRVYNITADAIYGFAGAVEPNLLVRMLTETSLREMHEDWPRMARQMVEIFHRSFAEAPDDEEAIALVTRLRGESAEFGDWWDGYGLRRFVPTQAVLRHPVLGRLALTYARFVVPASDPDQAPLVIVLQPAADAKTLERISAISPVEIALSPTS
jgi:transcriptional regulator with XRE-family HTH domain